MSANQIKGPNKKKAKKERDKRAKGREGLGRLFKNNYYLLNKVK